MGIGEATRKGAPGSAKGGDSDSRAVGTSAVLVGGWGMSQATLCEHEQQGNRWRTEMLCKWKKICVSLNFACGCVTGHCPRNERKLKRVRKDETTLCLPPRLAAISSSVCSELTEAAPSPSSHPLIGTESCTCLSMVAKVDFVPTLAYSVVELPCQSQLPTGSCGWVGWLVFFAGLGPLAGPRKPGLFSLCHLCPCRFSGTSSFTRNL